MKLCSRELVELRECLIRSRVFLHLGNVVWWGVGLVGGYIRVHLSED